MLPCFCVCRGNKRVTDRGFVCRGNKRLRNQANWSDKETGTSPTPAYPVCAGTIGLMGEPRKCGNDWTWGIFGGGRETRMVERENSPREHKGLSQIMASLLTVLCSTGTILPRKGNGEVRTVKERPVCPPGFPRVPYASRVWGSARNAGHSYLRSAFTPGRSAGGISGGAESGEAALLHPFAKIYSVTGI